MFRVIERRMPLCSSPARLRKNSAMLTTGRSVIGCDGISKTIPWKKYAPSGNFAHAETFPLQHTGADRVIGAFSSMTTTGDG
jgi:hypothetical protein